MTKCILGIETATDICSVGLSVDGVLVSESTLESGMRHSAALTGLIRQVLDRIGTHPSELTAIAISDGPGSYTGLRVGASTAKAMCYALDIPLIAVPTLLSLARDVDTDDHTHVLATLDARRMEVYASIIRGNGGLVRDTHTLIWDDLTIARLSTDYPRLIICGNGVAKAQDLIRSYPNLHVQPSACRAGLVLALASRKYDQGDFVNMAYHDPLYYKKPNITRSKKKIL